MASIVFVISSLGQGGAERTAVNLSSFLLQKGHDIVIATFTVKEIDFFTLDKAISR